MPGRSVWLRILGVEDSVLDDLVEEADGSVVAHVRPKRRQRQRCGSCGRRSPLYATLPSDAELEGWLQCLAEDCGQSIGYQFVGSARPPRTTAAQPGCNISTTPCSSRRGIRPATLGQLRRESQASTSACSSERRSSRGPGRIRSHGAHLPLWVTLAICRLSTSNRLAILGSAATMHANIRVHIFQKELE